MTYCHTQHAPLAKLLFALAVALGIAAWYSRDQVPVMLTQLGIAATFVVVASMFAWLKVSDEGDNLAIRYGPLPVFRKRIPYSSIRSVEASRSSIIDGWGIHWVPGRGWTYNLWGFNCAKLTVDGHVLRVGSDDVNNLVDFLQSKIVD